MTRPLSSEALRRRAMTVAQREREQRELADMKQTQQRLKTAFYERNPHLRKDAA